MKQDTKWRLRDSEGKEYIIIDSEKVDIQEELNKMITKQMKEIERQKEIIRQLDIKNLELTTIIKEVREYMKEIEGVYIDCNLYETQVYKDILEILDKEVN